MEGGDGSYDPCECVFSQEAAMRRLLSLLRSSQGYCTDNECVQELPGPQNTDGMFGGNVMMMIMMLWVAVAFALFFLRPRPNSQGNNNEKPSGSDQGSQPPPAPPVL